MGEAYPRIYRFKAGVLAAWLALELVMIAAGTAAVVFASALFPKAEVVGWLCGAFFIVLGLPALVSTLRGKFVLYADRGEYTGVLGRRIIPTDDVRETRNIKQQYGHLVATIVLKSGRRITISDFGRLDDVLIAWLDSFPNAEARAEEAAADALLTNAAFGEDDEARRAAIVRDAGWLTWLGRAGWVAGIWGLFYPHPYGACLTTLLVLPVVAYVLVLASRGRWTLVEARSGRLSAAGLAGLPATIVGLRALLDASMVDWKPAALAGAAVGAVLVVAVMVLEGRMRWGIWLTVAMACGAYGWGGLIYIDRHFDDVPVKTYSVRVLDKSSDKYADPLQVTAWGPRTSRNEISVGHAFSRRVKVGDTICITVYPGALRMPWYRYSLCK